jgi:LMBR1 domain-containing protein 1
VSFPIYIIALMSFISWFLFVIFGGIGLAALPLDLIYDFCTRPKKLNSADIEKQKKRVVENSLVLRELANEIRSLEDRGAKTKTSMKIKLILQINF